MVLNDSHSSIDSCAHILTLIHSHSQTKSYEALSRPDAASRPSRCSVSQPVFPRKDNPGDHDPSAQVWGCRNGRGRGHHCHRRGSGNTFWYHLVAPCTFIRKSLKGIAIHWAASREIKGNLPYGPDTPFRLPIIVRKDSRTMVMADSTCEVSGKEPRWAW